MKGDGMRIVGVATGRGGEGGRIAERRGRVKACARDGGGEEPLEKPGREGFADPLVVARAAVDVFREEKPLSCERRASIGRSLRHVEAIGVSRGRSGRRRKGEKERNEEKRDERLRFD